jgi:hypothetical protein
MFTKLISNVMQVSVNKQLKIASGFYLPIVRGRDSRFLASNLSAINITLCRVQHVTRELRVEWACTRHSLVWGIAAVQ